MNEYSIAKKPITETESDQASPNEYSIAKKPITETESDHASSQKANHRDCLINTCLCRKWMGQSVSENCVRKLCQSKWVNEWKDPVKPLIRANTCTVGNYPGGEWFGYDLLLVLLLLLVQSLLYNYCTCVDSNCCSRITPLWGQFLTI